MKDVRSGDTIVLTEDAGQKVLIVEYANGDTETTEVGSENEARRIYRMLKDLHGPLAIVRAFTADRKVS